MRLDVVVKDIVGLTGKKIITDFISGQTNGKELAKHRHYNIRKNKNAIRNTDMKQIGVQYFEGIDLMAIEGINDNTVMILISELGLEGIKKFKTAKEFTAWLRLAPTIKSVAEKF